MNAEKRFAERLQELVYDCGLKPEEISALCGVGLSRLRCWLSPRCTSLRMSKRQGEYAAVKRFRLHDFLSLYTRACFPHR